MSAETVPRTGSLSRRRAQVRSYYGIRRNLLIRFRDDSIDETPILADTLSVNSAVSENLDLSIRTLPGDHARPLQQVLALPL